MTSDASLLVRNYRGAQAPRIVVDYQLVIDSTGALRLVFDADQWDSVISFAPDIPITLDGTLDLEFADGIDIDRQVGRTFRIFDWTGVTPAGSFGLSSPYAWDLSQLYTAGQITLVPEPASLALLGAVGTASLYVRKNQSGARQTGCPADRLPSPQTLAPPAQAAGETPRRPRRRRLKNSAAPMRAPTAGSGTGLSRAFGLSGLPTPRPRFESIVV